MSGVEKLRARIAELATAIDLQKELSKTLERDKALAQRELNAALDPVARLPLEISSEIFLQSLPSFAERKPTVQDAPMLFLRICHAWRNIALLTSELWSGIQITFPNDSPGFEKGVQAWLDRASNRPLSISLCGPGYFDPGATVIVWQYAQQLKHLELCFQNKDSEESDDEDENNDDDGGRVFGIELLGDIPGPLPLLKTLLIRSLARLVDDQGYVAPPILDLLRSASNLVECTIQCASSHFWGFDIGQGYLALPQLRRISLGEDSNDRILGSLTLPGLETISMLVWDADTDLLLSLLKRSLPPLRELEIALNHADWTGLNQCLRLVPTVENFAMWNPRAHLLLEFLAALAESPSLLPGIRSLTIEIIDIDFCASWSTLLNALSSRRGHVRHVHVEALWGNMNVQVWPTDEILSAFKDLAAEGMQMYIGSPGGKSNII
ncbi:hypothetical protein DFH06DRAFT_1295045 [Mycena polygramma]|nr:hypothetical protein DFH06DRAFT_1295045 [Mycena polygramma]